MGGIFVDILGDLKMHIFHQLLDYLRMISGLTILSDALKLPITTVNYSCSAVYQAGGIFEDGPTVAEIQG